MRVRIRCGVPRPRASGDGSHVEAGTQVQMGTTSAGTETAARTVTTGRDTTSPSGLVDAVQPGAPLPLPAVGTVAWCSGRGALGPPCAGRSHPGCCPHRCRHPRCRCGDRHDRCGELESSAGDDIHDTGSQENGAHRGRLADREHRPGCDCDHPGSNREPGCHDADPYHPGINARCGTDRAGGGVAAAHVAADKSAGHTPTCHPARCHLDVATAHPVGHSSAGHPAVTVSIRL